MSISQINKLFQNKGCNLVVSIILGLSVITMLGVGTRGCGGAGGAGNGQEQPDMAPVATVGDFNITRDDIENTSKQLLSRYGSLADTLPASMRIQMGTGSALRQLVTSGLALLKAKQEGIDLSPSNLKSRLLAEATADVRSQLEQQGKLRPGATEQELENAFKAAAGQSFLDYRKSLEKQIDDSLNDDHKRPGVEASTAFALLVEKAMPKYVPSEESVRNGFETFRLKEIQISPTVAGPQGATAKAQQVLKEIKAGQSFESEMDKLMSASVQKGKKASDQVTTMTRSMIETDQSLKSLLDLKPGQVSDVITNPGGATIYKLVSRKLELPNDFQQQKKSIMDQQARTAAGKAIMEELKKMDTPDNVKWSSEGFHLLYQYASMEPNSPDQAKQAAKIIDEALQKEAEPVGGDAAAAVAMIALPQATAGMPQPQAVQLRAKVLAAYVQHFPEPDAKIELAETYIAAGDKDNAAGALRSAADSSVGHTEEGSDRNWERINRDVKSAEAKKLIDPDQVKAINDMYAEWQKQFIEDAKARKEQEDERKKVEQELKNAGKEPVPPTSPKGKAAPAPTGKPSGKK